MEDWEYCKQTLPKVSRTFALNISVLEGELYRSILVAYLFCRIVDTVEDAAKLDPQNKIKLLLEFASLMQDTDYRKEALSLWIQDSKIVDGSQNDLDLVANSDRVFHTFESLPEKYRNQIIPSVVEMARGMAYFQKKFNFNELTLLENENELEEYCFYVAGVVGEMLCNIFLQKMPYLNLRAQETLKRNAVSFGLGLQMTNISKDIVVDRGRGWSYVPRSFITENGLTIEEFNSGQYEEKDLKILERLLIKTTGHLKDALKFTLAIPPKEARIRLFCIWPLWMAMETVAVLHNNKTLLSSDDPVKISRQTVRRIVRRSRITCFFNNLLKASFNDILRRTQLPNTPSFDLDSLKKRLDNIELDKETNLYS